MNYMEHEPQGNAWKTLIAVSIGVFVVNVDYWSVSVALPEMAKEFDVTTIALDWVLSAYIISFCASVSVAGRLGDLFGRKKLLLLGIALFGAFSLWVGLSDSVGMIVAARIALGLGGGLIFALATAILGNACSVSDLTKMLGLLTGIGALGGAIGPVLGGLITETIGWQWIFYLNVPVTVLAFLAVKWGTVESYDTEHRGRIDYLGVLLLVVSITGLALFIAKVTEWGILSSTSIWMAAIIILFFCLFVTRENKCKNPLVDLKLFEHRTFAGFILSGALSKMYLAMIIFTTMILLEKVLSYDPLKAGLFFLAISGTVSISSVFLSAVTKAIGDKSTMLLSLVLQITGAIILLNYSDPIWILIGLAVAGPGCSWGFSTAMVGSITTLPRNLVGLASSASLTIIIMSAGIGVTIAGAVIHTFAGEGDRTTGINASIITAILAAAIAFLIALIVIPKRTPARKSFT